MQLEPRSRTTNHKSTKIIPFTVATAILLSVLSISSCQAPATAIRERPAFVPHARLIEGEAEDVRFAGLEEEDEKFGRIGDHIKSVVQGVPGSLAWQVTLPAGESMLEFALGYLCPEETTAGPVDVKVIVEHDGLREEVFSNSISINPIEQKSARFMERIPLSKFAGMSVTIRFESSVAEGGLANVELAWGYPVIFKHESTNLPNVILICMDTLRADRVAFINPGSNLMPNLMALAADGVGFSNAISQSSWTLPAVGTVLSGQYPSFHGAGKRIVLPEKVYQDELDDEEKELGIVVGESQFIVSKLPKNSIILPELMEDRYRCHIVNGNVVIGSGTDVESRFPSFVEGPVDGPPLTERAIEWLQANKDKRFFLYIHLMEPHEWLRFYRERWEFNSEIDVDKVRWMYDKMVKMGDDYFGQIMASLKELGLYEDSLIVFYADHGEHLYEENFFRHGHGMSLRNPLLHVPLVVKYPGNEYAGEVVSDYVKLADIFDTIMEESGTERPEDLVSQGVSLRDVIEGRLERDYRDTISEFMLVGKDRISLQAGPYRLVHIFDDDTQRLVDAATDKRIPFGKSRQIREISRRLIKELRAYIHIAEMAQDGLEASEFSEEQLKTLRELGYIQ